MSRPSDKTLDLVDQKCSELMEHFDAVQIFVSRHEGGAESTASYECGMGNIYTRQGQIDEWLRMQQQFQKNHAVRLDRKRG